MRSDPNLYRRCEVAAAELGLPIDGVVLVHMALTSLWQSEASVSAVRLCEGLLRCDGDNEQSLKQLRRFELLDSAVVGRVVYWFVRDGVIAVEAGESEADFAGLFTTSAQKSDSHH